MGLISGCRYFKVNLKAKLYTAPAKQCGVGGEGGLSLFTLPPKYPYHTYTAAAKLMHI
jgi:hypothetical protein